MSLSDRIRDGLRKLAEEESSGNLARGTQVNETPDNETPRGDAGRTEAALENGKASNPKALKPDIVAGNGEPVRPEENDFSTPMDVNKQAHYLRDMLHSVVAGLRR